MKATFLTTAIEMQHACIASNQ